jgi:phage-related protein
LYKIYYYVEDNWHPVLEFIQNQYPKPRAKIARAITLLKEHGFYVGGPFLKKVTGTKGLWELRIKYSSSIYRILFFSYYQGEFVLLHGFVKKTAKLPPKELKIALSRLKKFKKQRSYQNGT